jgi:hypothetical protein
VYTDVLQKVLQERRPDEIKKEEERLSRMSTKNRQVFIEQRNRVSRSTYDLADQLRAFWDCNRSFTFYFNRQMYESLATEAAAAQDERLLEAHYLLFHVYLHHGNDAEATTHLRTWLSKAPGRRDAVVFVHDLLTKWLVCELGDVACLRKEVSVSLPYRSLSQQALEDAGRREHMVLLERSLGPLGDLHLELLEELCRVSPDEPSA